MQRQFHFGCPMFGSYIKLTKAWPWSGSYYWCLAQCLAHMGLHKSKNTRTLGSCDLLERQQIRVGRKACYLWFFCSKSKLCSHCGKTHEHMWLGQDPRCQEQVVRPRMNCQKVTVINKWTKQMRSNVSRWALCITWSVEHKDMRGPYFF